MRRRVTDQPGGASPGLVCAPESDAIEAIEIHDLVPRGNEVARELLLRVRTGVDLRERTELRVRSEEEVHTAGGPSGIALLPAAAFERLRGWRRRPAGPRRGTTDCSEIAPISVLTTSATASTVM